MFLFGSRVPYLSASPHSFLWLVLIPVDTLITLIFLIPIYPHSSLSFTFALPPLLRILTSFPTPPSKDAPSVRGCSAVVYISVVVMCTFVQSLLC
ncbi:hypothetical protein BDV98DRAFT_570815 [Pterulicium gracile]|uniref:Uncharacterized protein n=1 Tax=Pterulicium gracile TaxID=1884261 RepID=A0A5C3QH12_9AGAR|nr:hypothetical protein BDV98DRAFT_570815 [Pterula gracilis]